MKQYWATGLKHYLEVPTVHCTCGQREHGGGLIWFKPKQNKQVLVAADLGLQPGFTESRGMWHKPSLVRFKNKSTGESPWGRETKITAHSDIKTLARLLNVFPAYIAKRIKGYFKGWYLSPYQHYLKEQTSISQAVTILLYAKYLHTLPHILFAIYRLTVLIKHLSVKMLVLCFKTLRVWIVPHIDKCTMKQNIL